MSDQQAQSTNFKEAFSLFDKRGNGRVALPDLGDLLRACGQNPTLAEIKDLESQMGGDCKKPCGTCIYATRYDGNADTAAQQSTLTTSSAYLTALVDSATPASLKSTAAASKYSIRSSQDSLASASSATSLQTSARR